MCQNRWPIPARYGNPIDKPQWHAKIEREYIDAEERVRVAPRTQDEWYEAHGAPGLQQRINSARSALWDARSALAETVPTTTAGLLACLEYVERVSLDMFIFEEDESLTFVASLANAVRRIAGLPAAPLPAAPPDMEHVA